MVLGIKHFLQFSLEDKLLLFHIFATLCNFFQTFCVRLLESNAVARLGSNQLVQLQQLLLSEIFPGLHVEQSALHLSILESFISLTWHRMQIPVWYVYNRLCELIKWDYNQLKIWYQTPVISSCIIHYMPALLSFVAACIIYINSNMYLTIKMLCMPIFFTFSCLRWRFSSSLSLLARAFWNALHVFNSSKGVGVRIAGSVHRLTLLLDINCDNK